MRDSSGNQTHATARVKPRLRGVSHELGFVASIPLGVLLGLAANGTSARVAAAVFAGSVVTMFGASALYHGPHWSEAHRQWLRRLDHAGIFGLIAGTYTPFGLLVLSGAWRIVVLAIVWTGGAAAIAMRLFWTGMPKTLTAALAVLLGWVGVVTFPQLVSEIGVGASMLVLAGGLCYTVGAVVYARRKPDWFPAAFGYHELFHALVVAAVALQYVAVAFFVLPR